MSDIIAIVVGLLVIAALLALLRRMNDPSWRDPYRRLPKDIARLSRESFGRPLSEAVATRLLAGPSLQYGHRDYCGHGLFQRDGHFRLAEIVDGYSREPAIATWDSADAFVQFLSAQSDFSCSGADPSAPLFAETDIRYVNNQRLTRRRLMEFVASKP